jgi:hypothetical protein
MLRFTVTAGPFDFIVTGEDMAYGQIIGNYSVEYRLKDTQVCGHWRLPLNNKFMRVHCCRGTHTKGG